MHNGNWTMSKTIFFFFFYNVPHHTSTKLRRLSECAFSFIFQVYFWKAPSGQIPPPQAEYKATIDTSTTLHLQAYTSYRFQVVAYNSVGDGPASNVVGPLTTPESSKCPLCVL